MKITELLNQSKDVSISFEFIPPLKGCSRLELVERLKPLMEFNPLFVDVTCHRNEIVFADTGAAKGECAKGFVHKKHPSILAVCEAIRSYFNCEVMPHVLCGGYTKAETEDLLLDLNFLGYSNVMALRGDKLLIEKSFSNPDGNQSARELITQILKLNYGQPLDYTIKDVKTDFCIAAACYPEKHIQSPNLEWERKETIKKYGDGAEFFISQMFFDNSLFYKFISLLNYPELPVLPGIKVLTNSKQPFMIPMTFGVSIPTELVSDMQSHPKEAGIEWAVSQCKDLLEHGYKHLHFFTMNGGAVVDVLKRIL